MDDNKEIDEGLYSDDDSDDKEPNDFKEFCNKYWFYLKELTFGEMLIMFEKEKHSTQSVFLPYSSDSLHTSQNPITS
jgi:hypothetical protein